MLCRTSTIQGNGKLQCPPTIYFVLRKNYTRVLGCSNKNSTHVWCRLYNFVKKIYMCKLSDKRKKKINLQIQGNMCTLRKVHRINARRFISCSFKMSSVQVGRPVSSTTSLRQVPSSGALPTDGKDNKPTTSDQWIH